MDRQQARNLIKETFEQPFDKARFVAFIKNLLNKVYESKAFHARGDVKESFRNVVKTYERIGSYDSSNGEKLDIIIVYLQKTFSIHHARVTQRNFAGKYLTDRGQKDAGLFAFVSPDDADWRFSLVKMDYKFEETPTGKMKVKEEFTHARRWSFLVGANEKSHTAQSRLEKILADDEHNPTLVELEDAFNIETVTKEFFLKYRDLFIRTKEALDRMVNNDAKIKADFEAKGVNTVDFAKKLLGQIVFLYFLQKKGWFGVARDADWGAGSKQFLRELFEKKHGDYHNFFNDILEPLFYEALRNDRSHDYDYYSRFNCKIPFLNGGLFDPIGGYDWVKTDILLPDSLFSNNTKTREGDTGDGILDIFNRYNFTVKEDEPLEKEVAIDPELLGKAYERFNAIRPDNFDEYKKALKSGKKGDESKFNKQFGVYYTPREIVHYMCQQSLINYLFTELNSGTTSYEKLGDSNLDMLGNEAKKGQLDITIEHKNPEISKEDIETLIHMGEQVSENEATALLKEKLIEEGKQKTAKNKLVLPESIRKNAKQIDDKLKNITVCDPAVGSGAFPVGMMNEIVKARNVLSTFIQDENRTTYDFKRRCIEHSLYGVDIDPGAVEIAKLRLWLSLMVDEEDIKNIKPLPNLDYKIVCGNSLLGVEKNLFNNQFFIDLEKLKPLYFNETNPTKKQNYKKQINNLISRITNGHKEFDFEVYFSEVFHKKTIEKNWKAYHITWVTHGSRVSERMVELGVRTGDPVVLDEASRLVIADALADKIQEKQYRVLAVNVLADHVHCVVVCEEGDVADIVQQLKGYSSHQHNRQLQLSVQGEGRQTKLWAKGSSQTLLESEEHLLNAIEYVQNNHIKHEVSEMGSSTHNRQLKQSVVGVDQAFAPITHLGGFDVVIANPPYVKEDTNKSAFDGLRHTEFYQGKMDLWYLFGCKGLDLLKHHGIMCFIATNNWISNDGASKFRNKVITNGRLIDFIDFGNYKVFTAGIQTMVYVMAKDSEPSQYELNYCKLLDDNADLALVSDFLTSKTEMSTPNFERYTVGFNRKDFVDSYIKFIPPLANGVVEKIKKAGTFNLADEEVFSGIDVMQDFVSKASIEKLGSKFEAGAGVFVISSKEKAMRPWNKRELEIIKPYYTTREINRYYANPQNQFWVLYTGAQINRSTTDYPNIKKHLDQFKNIITSVNKPYGLHRTREERIFLGEKILSVRKCSQPSFAYVDFPCYVARTFLVLKSNRINLKFLVGILNSKLIEFWLYEKGKLQGNLFQVDKVPLQEIPVKIGRQEDQNRVIELVNKILSLTQSTDYLQNQAKQAQVKEYEKQIDQMVYELYGLTEEEIAIIEKSSKNTGEFHPEK